MNLTEKILAITLLGLGAWGALLIRRTIKRFILRRRFKIAAKAEKAAIKVLESSGFKILKEQVGAENVFSVDGHTARSKVRADFIAEKQGKRYVVEVKSGESAPSPTNSATRRQLLEYEHVFKPDGLVLVNMSAATLHEVAFGITGGSMPVAGNRLGLSRRVVTFALGVLVGWLFA